jgi:hypothetical protein
VESGTVPGRGFTVKILTDYAGSVPVRFFLIFLLQKRLTFPAGFVIISLLLRE